jgi:hypothetical protein
MHSIVDPDRLVRSIVDNILSIMPRMDVRDDSGENPHDPPGIEVNPNPDQSLYEDEDDAANPDPSIKFAAAMIISFDGGQLSILLEKYNGSPTEWNIPIHVPENSISTTTDHQKSSMFITALNSKIFPHVLDKVPHNTILNIRQYPFFDILDMRVFFCDYRTLTTANSNVMEPGDQFKWVPFPNFNIDWDTTTADSEMRTFIDMLCADFTLKSNSPSTQTKLRDMRKILRGDINGTGDPSQIVTGETTLWVELENACVTLGFDIGQMPHHHENPQSNNGRDRIIGG